MSVSSLFNERNNGGVFNINTPTIKQEGITLSSVKDNQFHSDILATKTHTHKVFNNRLSLGKEQPYSSMLYIDFSPVDIDGGNYHSIALCNDGYVRTAGNNFKGQLGRFSYGGGTPSFQPIMDFYKQSPVKQVACGYEHTAVLYEDGKLQTFGYNEYGQLGDGTNTNQDRPVDVVGIDSGSGAIQVACGNLHTAVLFNDGTVKTFGSNVLGSLGNGTNDDSNTPVDVVGIGSNSGAIQVACGYADTAILFKDGSVKTFGDNVFGQLGNGTTTSSNIPVEVSGIGSNSGAIQVACGEYYTAVLFDDGSVKTFGYNDKGQLGNGTNDDSYTPVNVINLYDLGVVLPPGQEIEEEPLKVIQVACGSSHTVFLYNDGSMKAVGNNGSGQLGDGSRNNSTTPVSCDGVGPSFDILGNKIACGNNTTFCIAEQNGSSVLLACGRNNHYQLGLFTSGQDDKLTLRTPFSNFGDDNILVVSSGGRYAFEQEETTCILRGDGALILNSFILAQDFFTPFTGSHITYIKKPLDICGNIDWNVLEQNKGLIVSSIGDIKDITINNSHPYVKITKRSCDSSVYGVISKIENPTKKEVDSDYMKIYVNSVGEGGIWVCDFNGILKNGDYITSSNILGYGMKQNDDLLHNYTVAKIIMDCDFTDPERYLNKNGDIITKEEHKDLLEQGEKAYRACFVGCSYHCG